MNLAMKCLHRSFAIFRASLRSMPTLETIEEVYDIDEDIDVYDMDVYDMDVYDMEVYDMEPIGEPPELHFDNKDWIHWQSSDWGQWTDIEYVN